MTTGPRARARWLLLVGAALAVPYAPLFAGRVLYQRDLNMWQFPARWLLGRAIASGELPAWNPYQGLGLSVWADPLYGAAYPANWLFAISAGPWAVNLHLFMHLAFGAFGMFRLAETFRVRPAAAAVAALAWSLGGFTTSMWTFGILLVPFSWFGWIALGFVGLADSIGVGPRATARAAARAAAAVGMSILTGEIFLALLGVGFGIAVAAVRVADRPEPRATVRAGAVRLAGWALLAAVWGGLCGAVVVVPAALAAGGTERAAPFAAAMAGQGSFHPARVLEFGAANLTRAIFEEDAGFALRSLDGLQPLATGVYLGGGVLALALVALGRGRRTSALLAALAGLGLLLALGRHTPVLDAFRAVVRPFGYMRYPEKYLAVFVSFAALLAGLGGERLLDAAGGPKPPWRRVIVLAATILTAASAARLVLPEHLRTAIAPAALAGAAAAIAVLAAALVARARPRLGCGLLVAALAADLGAASVPQLHWMSGSAAAAPPPVARVVLADVARPASPAPPRLYRSPRVDRATARPGGDPLRWWKTLRDNSGSLHGIDTLPGYDAALPPQLSGLLDVGGTDALRLLGVQYAMLALGGGAESEVGSVLEPLMDPFPGVRFYRVHGALPRAYVAGAATRASDAEARAGVLAPDVVGGALVLVAPGGPSIDLPEAADGAGAAGSCTITRFGLRQIGARCQASRPALAVFVEQHASGWSATVDGAAAPLLRANLVMRAVPIPAGTHDVSLRFTPPGLLAGSILTGLAGLALLLAYRQPSTRA